MFDDANHEAGESTVSFAPNDAMAVRSCLRNVHRFSKWRRVAIARDALSFMRDISLSAFH